MTAPRPLTVADTGLDLRTALLDDLHCAVNALGGAVDANDPVSVGWNRAIDRVLDLIERRGGTDTLTCRAFSCAPRVRSTAEAA